MQKTNTLSKAQRRILRILVRGGLLWHPNILPIYAIIKSHGKRERIQLRTVAIMVARGLLQKIDSPEEMVTYYAIKDGIRNYRKSV